MVLYNIKAKTRKWSIRLKIHFLDFALLSAIVNCASGKHLDLLKFRNYIVEASINSSATRAPTPVCRPRHDREEDYFPAVKQLHVKSPIIEANYEGFGICLCILFDMAKYAKIITASGKRRIQCIKCKFTYALDYCNVSC